MEDILDSIGSYGVFQKRISWFIDFPSWLLVGAQTISLVFLTEEPNRFCNNPTDAPGGCKHGELLKTTDCSHEFKSDTTYTDYWRKEKKPSPSGMSDCRVCVCVCCTPHISLT
mmetsp:Transcript_42454/g.120482  ORF Transcript_42454/g.120482 Transcript_42454/m.120482 type:complete len:113 (+) Transcript_42454:76-414(+)